MKLLRKLFVIAALLCFLCPVEPTGFGQQQVKAPTISWYVRFYPANSDYVEVTLNATEFAPKYLVRDARVSVEFRNKNGTAIGKGNFDFTDGRIHELTGGGTYRRYFKHDFKSAASVFGDQLKYAIWEVGHGVGAPRPIFGSFETLLSLREH